MNLTLICHFYNEEFFLPHFIRHYQHQVDHAVMINYASTDRSVDIIKEMAPNWEIRPSCNAVFDEPRITKEVASIEREFKGWKMCMNVTEYVLHPNLKDYLQTFESQFPNFMGVRVNAAYMVDSPTEENLEVSDESLMFQRHHGYFEREKFLRRWRPDSQCTTQKPPRKSRLIHKHADGNYSPGRHDTHHKDTILDHELVMCWFNWCPMKHVGHRRTMMGERFTDRVKQHAKGRWYFENDEQFYNQYLMHQKIADNLLDHEIYKRAYDYFILHFPKLRESYLQSNSA